MKTTTVVNIWGGSGCGKSTLAALLYGAMKLQHRSVELVREYAKKWAWEGRAIRPDDEIYLFTKQLQAESYLYGKVDWIITDRPLGLSAVYERFYKKTGGVETIWEGIIREQMTRGIQHIDLMMERPEAYIADGRYESAEDAKRVDQICKDLMPGMPVVSTAEQVLNYIDSTEKWVCAKCEKPLNGASMTLGGGNPFCIPCGNVVHEALESSGQLVFSDN